MADDARPGRKLWQAPTLHSGDEARGVGWLDLFFDLFFVALVAELAHHLTEHPGAAGVRTFLFLFIPVWWVWIGDTYYGERFETEGLESRLYLYALMLPVIGMAVYAHDGLGETYTGFALSYAAARAVIAFMWGWATVTSLRFRPTGRWYTGAFSLSILLVVVSVFVSSPVNLILFGAALLIDLLTPIVTRRLQNELPGFSASRLPTRFGLFTIVALALGLWWLYFDFIGRRRPKGGGWMIAWSHLHLPFVIAVAAIGAGVTNVIAAEGILGREVQHLIGGFVGVALLTLALLEPTLIRTSGEPTHRALSPLLKVFSGAAAFVVGFALPLNSLLFLGLLVALLLVNMVYRLWVWFSQGGAAESPEAESPEVAIGA